jgi:hypothetical protein
VIFRSFGFTLLEVMISICLLGGVVTAIIEFQAKGMNTVRKTINLTNAIMLGKEKMVEWERGIIPEGGGEGDFGSDAPDFRWRMNVIDTNMWGLKKISLTIIWEEEGRERELVVQRLWFQEESR